MKSIKELLEVLLVINEEFPVFWALFTIILVFIYLVFGGK